MATNISARDWDCCGIAQMGGGIIAGGGVSLWEFRSRTANFRGTYMFIGAGFDVGIAFGGTSAPSPSDVYHGRQVNPWSRLTVARAFSANDLNNAYGGIESAGISPTYGYSLTRISAGLTRTLFEDQDVSGWGAGLSLGAGVMRGLWQRMSESNYY